MKKVQLSTPRKGGRVVIQPAKKPAKAPVKAAPPAKAEKPAGNSET